MNIVVCVKQILDPEIPMDKFRVRENQVVPPQGIPPVINPYDAQAVEAALQLKGKLGGKVTALSLGGPDTMDVVRHALSMGADEGAVVNDAYFKDTGEVATAYSLSQAIKKIGAFDLVLCGREAADWNMGIVGPALAEILDPPIITLAKKVEPLNASTIKIERVIPDGSQIFEVSLPALVTISKEIGLPRLPTGRGIIKAAQAKIPVWTAQDIAVDPSRIKQEIADPLLVSLSVINRERKCEFVGGENAAEVVRNLMAKLRSAGMT